MKSYTAIKNAGWITKGERYFLTNMSYDSVQLEGPDGATYGINYEKLFEVLDITPEEAMLELFTLLAISKPEILQRAFVQLLPPAIRNIMNDKTTFVKRFGILVEAADKI